MAGPEKITISQERLEGHSSVELKRILEEQREYDVDLSYGDLSEASLKKISASSRLLIPILPSSPADVRLRLAKLSPEYLAIPVLPAFSSESSIQLLDPGTPFPMDFLFTPFREAEVRTRVKRILAASCISSKPITNNSVNDFGGSQLIGFDPSMGALRRKVRRIAQAESPVLLLGETGTGKERFARALHEGSKRASKPFFPVNCGAIPQDLVENELFGHRKGAFTGAVSSQQGMISAAEGGTLFLDEVEALSLQSQVKLLRFLQDQTYYVVGSSHQIKANVWVIAASNEDLSRKAAERSFREDLFYRLAGITLTIPPLRERLTDIPVLARYFLEMYEARHGKQGCRFSAAAIQALCAYAWPGNVRELENVVQEILVLSDCVTIEVEHLPERQQSGFQARTRASFQSSKAAVIANFERSYISELLRVHRGNVTQCASAAQKERRAFGRLIRKYQLEKQSDNQQACSCPEVG